MEFFNKSRTIRLRSHLDKYLLAEDDEETVRQSRNESTKKVIWTVEFVEDNSHVIRLKSSSGRYLTASEEPLLLGMTGKKVMQTSLPTKFINKASAASIEWEPIRESFQVKLRSRNGSFLRGNGATKPWRNTVTHDRPTSNSTQNWILWDVILVDSSELERSFADYESQLSSFSSISESFMDSPTSPWSVESTLSPIKIPIPTQRGMEFFNTAKAVRLKGHHDKYLVAEEDEESVSQDRNGSSKTAKWSVEFIQGGNFIRLKSCFGKYLTASNSPFLLGMTGRKVTQSLPSRLDSSLEWEPVRDGALVKLKTRYGNYLRANGGLPPWRNSVTHDVPHRTATQEWVLWDVDILELQVHSPKPKMKQSALPTHTPLPAQTPLPVEDPKLEKHLSKLESSDSFGNYGNSFPKKVDGRLIYYSVADDNGNVDDGIQEESFNFKGNGVEELTQKLEEETGLYGIVVCTRSPLNGKLYPLRLHLPPNNSTMHVVVVQSASRVARSFTNPDAL